MYPRSIIRLYWKTVIILSCASKSFNPLVQKADEEALVSSSTSDSQDVGLKKNNANLAHQIRSLQSNEEVLKGRLSVAEAELEKTNALLEAAQRALDANHAANEAISVHTGGIGASTSSGGPDGSKSQQGEEEESSAPAHCTRGQKKGAKTATSATNSTATTPKTPGRKSNADPLPALSSPEASLTRTLQDQIDMLAAQLKTANESNVYLQKDIEGVMKKLHEAQEQCKKLESGQAPLVQELRTLRSEKAAMTELVEKESNERAMWQEKYTAYLRQTPKQGIDEAEYDRVSNELAKLREKLPIAGRKMSQAGGGSKGLV